GISFSQGAHQVAQKSMNTTLSRRSAVEKFRPYRSRTEKSGRCDPISPAKTKRCSLTKRLTECESHPASPTTMTLNNKRCFVDIHSLLCTSRISSFNDGDASGFFFPAGFLYN